MTEFSDSEELKQYAQAYAKQVGYMSRGKKKEFFGDPDWWINNKKEWTEIQQSMSDPLTRPGNQPPSGGMWGNNGGIYR